MKYSAIICVILFFLFSPYSLHGDSDIYVTKKDYPMAVSETDLDQFNYSMKENHVGLWLKLQQERRGWLSKPGIEVVIIEKKEPNKVKIRAVDSNDMFWTFEEALRKK